MASMSLDPSSALAEKYKGNRQILEQAVLGVAPSLLIPTLLSVRSRSST